ncbi:NADPH-dependent FMN reductase [Cryptosporangium aurantiacum]|uniref:NAD(P)H-dependent FMN reductase n=1 Tax=Cryptosporangium aurantiacum TaxID=134849 RepID=A0A1M7H567_9ACTN|nr:NAD(P)H-dependent oxidoreductase [Cryptosporangium aurantiacum]SHM23680.1 NAD(P)H-dependent FMN reductase [Cryptosporangium aurantiacum]
MESAPLRIAVIAGSTRPDRKSRAVARWVTNRAAASPADFVLVDLADHPLPFLDEPLPAIHGSYAHPHTRAWAALIDSFDAYVFVVPEYNRSIPAVLKNALDFLHAEWRDKAAGFVGYGADASGARAVEHLRLIMGELQVADVRSHVLLSAFTDFDRDGAPRPPEHAEAQLHTMLEQLLSWGTALRSVRTETAAVAG